MMAVRIRGVVSQTSHVDSLIAIVFGYGHDRSILRVPNTRLSILYI